MILHFTSEFRNCLDMFSTPMALRTCSCLIWKPSSFALLKRRRTWSFHVLVLQKMAKKCTNVTHMYSYCFFIKPFCCCRRHGFLKLPIDFARAISEPFQSIENGTFTVSTGRCPSSHGCIEVQSLWTWLGKRPCG